MWIHSLHPCRIETTMNEFYFSNLKCEFGVLIAKPNLHTYHKKVQCETSERKRSWPRIGCDQKCSFICLSFNNLRLSNFQTDKKTLTRIGERKTRMKNNESFKWVVHIEDGIEPIHPCIVWFRVICDYAELNHSNQILKTTHAKTNKNR